MTVNGGQDVGLFFVYGWKGARRAEGPFFVRSAGSQAEGIVFAREALQDRRWTRTTVNDVRAGVCVFDSAEPEPSRGPRLTTRPEQERAE